METRRLISACRIKTSYTQNILSVESSINIKGGTSNTSIGGAGVYGENFTLNNNGSVWEEMDIMVELLLVATKYL